MKNNELFSLFFKGYNPPPPPRKILKNKGFSLIGVLVAMSVGSIVVAGLSKVLSNASIQMTNMETQIQRNGMLMHISHTMSLGEECTNTLKATAKTTEIAKGGDGTNNDQPIVFKNIASEPDLDLTKDETINRNGLRGDVHYRIVCNTAPDCKCEGKGAGCESFWNLEFVSQSFQQGVLVYRKAIIAQLTISYENAVTSGDSDSYDDLTCGYGVSITGGTGGGGLSCTDKHCGTGTASTASTAERNTLMGFEAGKAISVERNTLIGYKAGYPDSDGGGYGNTFIGYATGFESPGEKNTFIGYRAGDSTLAQNKNIFIGYETGFGTDSSGENNIIIGNDSDNNGSDNILIGNNIATNASDRENNIIIGNNIGQSSDPDDNPEGQRNFIVGFDGNIWLEGNMGNRDFFIKGQRIRTDGSSSRTLKKNIKPFKDFDGSLQDILKTPLFTYEFKDDQPKKVHRGIISEELPLHLQIKEKGKVSRPAWPSIYGTLWAGIKALHDKLVKLETSFKNILKQVKNNSKENSSLKEQIKQLQKELEKNNKRLKELEKLIRETQKESGTKVLKE